MESQNKRRTREFMSKSYSNQRFVVNPANVQGNTFHVNVVDKATQERKNICFKPNEHSVGSKLFDWDPWIDGAALVGSAIAPELMPWIQGGKEALKHWLKGDKKSEKKNKKKHGEERRLERGMETKAVERRLSPLDLATQVPNVSTIHHPTFRVEGGKNVVTTYDGKTVDYEQARTYSLKRGYYSKTPFKAVNVMPGLRQIIDQKVPVVEPTAENSLIGKNSAFKAPVSFAKLKNGCSLHSSGVPVLQGDMALQMDKQPVEIVKSDAHAVIAGSELLGDLIVPAGGGAAGTNVFTVLLNPRFFQGTKLANESLTWLQYRFRKFVVEYVPIVGSGQAGSFIEFYSQDPLEVQLTGLNQRRNAGEHDKNVPFQPFSYVACAMIPKPDDKTLYYMDDVSADQRLVYQGMFVVTNNANNADTGTVPTYGSFWIHYECDFYFPSLSDTASGNGPVPSVTLNNNPAAVVGADVILMGIKSSFTNVNIGTCYIATIIGPNGDSACQFPSPLGRTINFVRGMQYVVAITAQDTGNWFFKVYQTIGDAQEQQNALLYTATTITNLSTWVLEQMTKVTPVMLGYTLREPEPTPKPIDLTNDSSEFTASERDIVNIYRQYGPNSPISRPAQLTNKQLGTVGFTPTGTK